MRLSIAALILALAACTPAKKEEAPPAPAAPPPVGSAIECSLAQSPAEKAICADPALIAADAQVAKAFSDALLRYADAPELDAALKEDQIWFNGFRDYVLEDGPDAPTLAELLPARAAALGQYAAPREGFVGRWAMGWGEAIIAEDGKGGYRVRLSTADPSRARWLCELDLPATLKDGILTVTEDRKSKGMLGGWGVALATKGGVLTVTETAPAGEGVRPYCGASGQVAGSFLPAENAAPDGAK
jgi:uncharacterized protein YecT (DUF1311 family)